MIYLTKSGPKMARAISFETLKLQQMLQRILGAANQGRWNRTEGLTT